METSIIKIRQPVFHTKISGLRSEEHGITQIAQGFMVSGWQTIGGYKYYFYSDTKYMARNVIIEGLSIGDDGRVVAFGTRYVAQFTTVSTNNSNRYIQYEQSIKEF